MSEEVFYSLAEKGLFRTESAKTKIHWTLEDSQKIKKKHVVRNVLVKITVQPIFGSLRDNDGKDYENVT